MLIFEASTGNELSDASDSEALPSEVRYCVVIAIDSETPDDPGQ